MRNTSRRPRYQSCSDPTGSAAFRVVRVKPAAQLALLEAVSSPHPGQAARLPGGDSENSLGLVCKNASP